jgi:protocatechuate 3,4-dioxygenase beta subunit
VGEVRGASARRQLLIGGAATLALAACSDNRATSSRDPSTSSTAGVNDPPTGPQPSSPVPAGEQLTAAHFSGLGTCTLVPESIAGPFPLDEQFFRRDITERYPGHPLRLGLRVLDGDCASIPGAVVEIWHADASGDYSAFADGGGGKDEAGGTTFLRGSQIADQQGIVEFLTIYPGWYRGRAVHIHLRVHVGDATILTSQLYFDEAYTESVYASGTYAAFGNPDTSQAADALAGDVTSDGTLLVTSAAETARGKGTLGLLNLGVEAG